MIGGVLCSLLALAATDATKVNQLGPVTVTTTLAPDEPTIGDEITLESVWSGEGRRSAHAGVRRSA